MPGVDAIGLAHEHAALRRVAELVATGASPFSAFDVVAREVCHLLGGHLTALPRYDPDGPAVIVAMCGADSVRHGMHVGMHLSRDGDGMVQRVRRSERGKLIDSYARVPGTNAALAWDRGLTSAIGVPIITEEASGERSPC